MKRCLPAVLRRDTRKQYRLPLAIRYLVYGFALAFLGLFVSCALAPKQTVNYKAAMDRKFEPSKQPAQVTTLTESQLLEQGYIKIGDLYVEQVYSVCYERAREYLCTSCSHVVFDDCQQQQYSETLTDVLTKEAAERGGQLVKLASSNQLSKRAVTRATGFCKRDHTETRTEQEAVYSLKGNYYQTVQKQYTICDEYHVAHGEQTLKWSKGGVWRKME